MTCVELSDEAIRARISAGARCLLCREDRGRAAMLCGGHEDELGRMLDPEYAGGLEHAASIPVLFDRLDPTPTATGLTDRRAPGYGSAPPCDLNVVTMRDPRSVAYPVIEEWYEMLYPGISTVDYSQPHYEDPSPPRSAEKVIAGLVEAIRGELVPYGPLTGADHRTDLGIHEQCGWLHDHLGHLAARDDADLIYDDVAELHHQLRGPAGDPKPKPVAKCTGWVRAGTVKVECGYPLYLPPPRPGVQIPPGVPVLRCARCDRPYTAMMMARQEIGEQRRAG